MKKIILSTFLLLFIASSFAQIKGSLTIYAKEGEKIWVIKNGVKQNKEASTNVIIKDISDKYFKIKVIIDDESMTSVDKQIQMVDVDNKMCNITYELRKKKNAYGLTMISWDPANEESTTTKEVDNSTTNKGTNTNLGTTTQTNMNIENNGVTQTTTTGQTQTNVGMGQNGATIAIKDPELGVDFNVNMNIPNGEGVVTSSTTTTTTTTTSGTNNGKVVKTQPKEEHREIEKHPKHPNYSNGCNSAMPTADFNEAKNQVTKASFADDKLTIAKQITESNCLSVLQIKEIAKAFSFEDNKLEYLKFAYDFTFEKNKYYLVNDILNFSSSKEDLNKYIQSKK